MHIIQQVKELIQRDNLDSKDRHRDLIYKRSYLYAILRDEGWNFSQIGRLLNRNHATVINGLKIHDQFFGKDKIYDRYVKHYDSIFKPSIEEVMLSKDAIFHDIMNCYNTTELRFIKERIVAGWYDKV
jgi:hypothetical protein